MKREVLKFEWECDFCKKKETVEGVNISHTMPENWTKERNEWAANYGSYRTDVYDVCPECQERRSKK